MYKNFRSIFAKNLSAKKDSKSDSKKDELLVLIEPKELKITPPETKDSKEEAKTESAETADAAGEAGA